MVVLENSEIGTAPREISGVQILNHIDPIFTYVRIEKFERSPHVTHHVTAVIQNNIRRSKFVNDLLEKVQVALIAYSNGDLVLFHHFARGIDVNTDNLSKWAEIAFPQLERADLADADFDKCCRAVHEPAKCCS